MSFKGTNSSENSPLSNAEIKSILLNIYDRLTKASTKEVGYELFIKLILKNLYSSSSISFILAQLSEFIPPLPPKEKEPCLKLLSLVFFDPITSSQNCPTKKKTIYFQYLSSVLSIIQSLTKESNNSIFASIANTYAEIVQNTMPTDIIYATEELDMEEKRAYEMLQGFCIYNMKQEEKSNRIIGSLCLTKLVENCPIVLQEQYMKFIWDNILNFIDIKNYTAKYELLNCLISLILGAEGLFAQFATATLYKVLDFLTEDDWNKRKLALNVIYTLIFYCKDEIIPLKDHIISFLRVLKTDKVKEVREVCLLILQIFNENEPGKKKNEKQKSIGSIINKNKISKNNNYNAEKKENTDSNLPKTKNKSKIKTGIRQKKNNKFFENNKKFSSNPFKYNDFEDHNIKKSTNTNNINNVVNSMNVNEEENNFKSPISLQSKTSKETNTNSNTIGSGNAHTHSRSKGKKSNNFVNEKMKIKPDPNKSIFKAIPNPAFFSQGNKKNNDIIVMAKEKPKNIIQNNNNNNINKKNANINSENKKKDSLQSPESNINYISNKENSNKVNNNKKNEKENEDLRYKNMFNNKEKENMEEDLDNEKENDNNYIDNNDDDNNNNNENYNDVENNEIYNNGNNYDHKNEYKEKRINNFERDKGNESEDINPNIIKKLLAQMDFLTKGHDSLMNMFDNIQLDTQEQIESLNKNFGKLESKTNILNKDLNDYFTNIY